MEQLRAILIVTRNQERHTKRPAHDALLAIRALTEAQRQIADGLGAALDAEGLVVVEEVALTLDAGVLDHGAGVGLETAHGAADVAVDLDDLLDGGGFEEGGGDALLDAEDDALGGGDADGRGAELDGLEGVFDLEEAAFGGEGVDTPVWRDVRYLQAVEEGELLLPYSDLAINIVAVFRVVKEPGGCTGDDGFGREGLVDDSWCCEGDEWC